MKLSTMISNQETVPEDGLRRSERPPLNLAPTMSYERNLRTTWPCRGPLLSRELSVLQHFPLPRAEGALI